jgi:hypothetical protein
VGKVVRSPNLSRSHNGHCALEVLGKRRRVRATRAEWRGAHVQRLYREFVCADGCAGGEDEVVAGAVDEAASVEACDRINDAEPLPNVAD